MQLAVHEFGAGEQTAILIHGIMSDHRAWDRVTAELVDRGFRVLAVDLAGHGRSPRARRYSPRAWADDVVETVEPLLRKPPALVMGHSLGGLVASLAADRLAPRAAIYVDPAFAFPRGVRGLAFKLAFALAPRPRRSALVRWNPRWSPADVENELAAVREWDKRTILGFADTRPVVPPLRLAAPSLVVLAERSLLITDAAASSLRRLGMTVETLAGAGHSVFRDDLQGFMHVVEGWLARHGVASVR
ncbi:alpha/beta fold hydrolase [Homoserinibacter sp. GY 40078]|uniref:alpha/beta fold hydrolase n=1 Tax=Homoserinibacter sp. GY 40078 TaxID=2603275 RepID=UPI0011CBB5AE|nr:alpha/beta fold hydrolase [Homoserinibacter sp. GY 40078]TXK19838.1 alpha/beta fold hydrolase [Homoserinibacter sp. GY 40078]